jgi:hypothetical protein
MYGLILDFFWNGGQEPVTVTMTGSLAELLAVTEIDPSYVAATWSRAGVFPIQQHRLRSAITGMILDAHICAQNDI